MGGPDRAIGIACPDQDDSELGLRAQISDVKIKGNIPMSKKNWTGRREPKKPKQKRVKAPIDNTVAGAMQRKPVGGNAA